MSKPGYAISIFSRIRREAGQTAQRLARRLEKNTFKLEAHHRHLHFTHQAVTNCWLPKSLRFKAPGQHPIFKRIMERASKHCMNARITICHDQIKTLKLSIRETNTNLASLLQPETYQAFSQFLNTRAISVRDNINERHSKKLNNLANEYRNSNNVDKTKWVVNISSRSLTKTEVEVLQKGPKFAPAPSNIPYKEIVANIETGIGNLADDTKELVRNATASILDKAQLPANNVSKYEKRALSDLKKDESIVIMKADKGNCFVVMDRSD